MKVHRENLRKQPLRIGEWRREKVYKEILERSGRWGDPGGRRRGPSANSVYKSESAVLKNGRCVSDKILTAQTGGRARLRLRGRGREKTRVRESGWRWIRRRREGASCVLGR